MVGVFHAVPVLPATAMPKSEKVEAAVPSVHTCHIPSRTTLKYSSSISAFSTTSGSAVSFFHRAVVVRDFI